MHKRVILRLRTASKQTSLIILPIAKIMSCHSDDIDQAEIFNGVNIKHFKERIDGNGKNATMVSADGLPAVIPENHSRTGRVRSTANETLICGKAASDTPSSRASTKINAHSDVTGLAVIKSHHGRDRHDDGNMLFLNESKSADSVRSELGNHVMEVQDDKNTTTVVKGAETKHPILMLYGNGNSSRFCNDNSGENVDGNEDQHMQKDVPFEEKKRSTQSESYTVIDQESSAFYVLSQCTTSIRDLKKMLYYSGSASGKQDNFGSARLFTENEAERNEKSNSFEHVSGENTDDAVNAVHGVGIDDAKKVRFVVPTHIAADLDSVTEVTVTNPKSRINHAGTSNERTDVLLKQKEKYHELVVEEVKPIS